MSRPGRPSFVKVRVGIVEHMTSGRMTSREADVFLRLLVLVGHEGDVDRGVVWTSAADLRQRFFPRTAEVTVRKVIRSLRTKGYLATFRSEGSRGTYPLVIDGWESLRESRRMEPHTIVVNASLTTDWRRPHFERIGERELIGNGVGNGVGIGVGNGVGIGRSKEEESEEEGNQVPQDDGGSFSSGPEEGPLARHGEEAARLVAAYDAALEAAGLPPDTRSPKALAADHRAAARLLERLGDSVAFEAIIGGAAHAIENDDYLKGQGHPFALFASSAQRHIRAVAAHRPKHERSLDELLDEVDREEERS